MADNSTSEETKAVINHKHCDLWALCNIAGVRVFIDRSHGNELPYVCGACWELIGSEKGPADLAHPCMMSQKTVPPAPAKKKGSKRFFEK